MGCVFHGPSCTLLGIFQNIRSRHYWVVRTMGEFLHSRRGSTVFCVPCGFCLGDRQNTWTRLMCNMCSLEKCVFFKKSYYSTQKNLKEVLCLYGEQFNVPCHKWPSKSVIILTVKKFGTGSVHDDKAGKVGAKQTAWSEENIDQVRKIMHAIPQTSITQVAQEIGMSVASAQQILLAVISLFLYKIQVHQALSLRSQLENVFWTLLWSSACISMHTHLCCH